MYGKTRGKRPAPPIAKPAKKAKVAQRTTVPIPENPEAEDSDVSEQDIEFFVNSVHATSFLQKLDKTAISKSKPEITRLHELTRPARTTSKREESLPSVDSGSDEEEYASWSSNVDSDALQSDSETEQPYETKARGRRPSWNSEDENVVEKLPIKLGNGRVQKVNQVHRLKPPSDSEDSDDEGYAGPSIPPPVVDDVSTGARFGRPAVVDIIATRSRKARIQGAKEQLASISQDIIADPENSLGLLRRLHTFSLAKVSSPTHPEPVENDVIIRKLAILSQMAVFKDIIPGYRIRSLTEHEKAEKVSQLVGRTRDWEQGLVNVYQTFLKGLDHEVKEKTELADICLQCICTLLVEATHFNFRTNLMSSVVTRLSKKSWDSSSDLCLNTLITVFKNDISGTPSLEAVRLLNRMIKEKRFNVHPKVLSCLFHLRLKSELGVRASRSHADRSADGPAVTSREQLKGKRRDKPHLSKKAKKALKENKAIEVEMREAAAEVDKEEKAATQTETLKLLFVLYFSILKNPILTPLLPSALEGVAKFAHLVNVDFFKDLLQTLRDIILHVQGTANSDAGHADSHQFQHHQQLIIRIPLLCIVTAFELLSGQGEALNIDLDGFVNELYATLLLVGVSSDIEDKPEAASAERNYTSSNSSKAQQQTSISSTSADLLFRALSLAFLSRTSGSQHPAWRCAAFVKRLLTASLSFPSSSALRSLEFVRGLITKTPTLEALLATDDRAGNGIYRAELDDPQLANAFGTSLFELHLLRTSHGDVRVRNAAAKLADFAR